MYLKKCKSSGFKTQLKHNLPEVTIWNSTPSPHPSTHWLSWAKQPLLVPITPGKRGWHTSSLHFSTVTFFFHGDFLLSPFTVTIWMKKYTVNLLILVPCLPCHSALASPIRMKRQSVLHFSLYCQWLEMCGTLRNAKTQKQQQQLWIYSVCEYYIHRLHVGHSTELVGERD